MGRKESNQTKYIGLITYDSIFSTFQDPMTTPRDSICIPLLENFMGDIGDGCSLAVLLNFYCPQIVKIEGITLDMYINVK